PEAVAAVPAAVLLIATGAIPGRDALTEAQRLGPVIGFLAAVLVIAQLCDDEGLFRACGAWLARGSRERPRRLLVQVFAAAARLRIRPRPYMYACTHLANSASLLLPVSNLTNLLAFSASGLSFGRFAALMALPWLTAIGAEYAVLSRYFRTDLSAGPKQPEAEESSDEASLPKFTVAVVALTLAGFAIASAAGVNPAWAALAGAAVLAVRGLAQRRTSPAGLARAADVPFLIFVLGLGIVVKAVVDNGLSDALHPLLPSGTSLPALLAVAALSAVLANLINNLPAVLVLLPLAAPSGA